MYIKLTRLDNSPIWFNTAFIVTIEPRKGGGSVVVPIGDGLDYDVRETPAQVLALLDGAPTPAVVPVPPPKGLAPTPEDVSPSGGFAEVSPKEADTVPASEPAPAAEPASADEVPVEAKTAKRTRRATKKSATGEETPKAPRKTRAKAKKSAVEIPDEMIERLRKMMPGSTRKLLNTLVTQFRVEEAESVVAALRERGIIEVDREHVIWKQEETK